MVGRETVMRNKIGIIFMMMGAVLVLAALSLFFWNVQEDKQAGAFAEELLTQVIEHIEISAADGAACPNPYDFVMPEAEIEGYACIGCLSIPAINLELPVLSEWNDDRLKIALCRYSGSSRMNNLVIAAHNYANHFGHLSRLSPGDVVYFVDMDGLSFSYEVTVVEVLGPEEVEEMTDGTYDLTLFTCTYSGQNRLTVRCERTEDK